MLSLSKSDRAFVNRSIKIERDVLYSRFNLDRNKVHTTKLDLENSKVYFKRSYVGFFKRLELNNNSRWVLNNLTDFESNVYRPFATLILDVIGNIRTLNHSIDISTGEAICDIFHDGLLHTRDKIQFNTYMAAFISKYGKGDKSYPGTYIKIDSQSILLRFGILESDWVLCKKIKKRIQSDYETFVQLLNQSAFKSHFRGLVKSKNTVLRCTRRGSRARYPLISHTNFYCEVTIDISLITAGKLLWLIMQHYRAALPLLRYLEEVVEAVNFKDVNEGKS